MAVASVTLATVAAKNVFKCIVSDPRLSPKGEWRAEAAVESTSRPALAVLYTPAKAARTSQNERMRTVL